MFIQRTEKIEKLDEVIEQALQELAGLEAHTDEYRNVVNQITALNAIRETRTDRLKLDTIVLVAGNIAGILAIVSYEQKHVLTSKATSFVKALFK